MIENDVFADLPYIDPNPLQKLSLNFQFVMNAYHVNTLSFCKPSWIEIEDTNNPQNGSHEEDVLSENYFTGIKQKQQATAYFQPRE